MEIRRVLLLTIAILCMIAFLVFFFIDLFSIGRNSSPPRPGEFNIAYRQIPFHRFLLSLILLIISIFTLSYYFLSRLLESRLEKNMMLISKLISRGKENVITKKGDEKSIDREIILKFLNPVERKIMKILIENNGKVLQAEINRIEGMTKLKTHRTVKDMERKGIIKRESFGKTNRIILSDDIKDLFK